jgi:DNA-directed RNA polymerase subunit RPC12/RpoP
MARIKGGMNDYLVFVVNPKDFSETRYRCDWFGHLRFRCGKCRKGYFNVKNDREYDESCPECRFMVIIRADDRE